MQQIKIAEYEITDYGIDHAQYFQGHGLAFTQWTYKALGCGDTYQEALEDALESAVDQGFEIELTIKDAHDAESLPSPKACEVFEKACEEEGVNHEECECELYYYVGLRW